MNKIRPKDCGKERVAKDDLLIDTGYDTLPGRSRYDSYYVSYQDVIENSDGSGFIMFNDKAIISVTSKKVV